VGLSDETFRPHQKYDIFILCSFCANSCVVPIENIVEIQFGQRSKVFLRNKRPDLDHLSFSVYFESTISANVVDTLDLVCKDVSEFELWTSVLIGLFEKTISEEVIVKAMLYCSTDREVSESLSMNGRQTSSKTVVSDKKLKQRNSNFTIKARLKNSQKELLKEAFTNQNEIYTCGWNAWGQSCIGDTSDVNVPTVVHNLLGKGVSNASMGWAHSVIVLDSGKMYTCGNKLGTGMEEDTTNAAEISTFSSNEVQRVSCGYGHSLALTDSGEVFSWGTGIFGQLGIGKLIDVFQPTLVRELMDHKIETITCGFNFCLALSAKKQVFAWGINSHGCLGLGDTEMRHTPTEIVALDELGVDSVAAGEYHVLASTERGLYSWGWNGNGQLGHSGIEDSHVPMEVPALHGGRILDISCGNAHSAAVVSSGDERTSVYLWGNNMYEQLGMEDVQHCEKPTAVKQLIDKIVIEIECGAFHTAVLTESGQVLLAGANLKGQLGLGREITSTPVFQEPPVLMDKHVRNVFCGAFNTAFLVARQWVDDAETDSCMTCRKNFTMRIRRHHCRNCGGIFCNSCSSKTAAILKYGITRPVRVCDTCHVKLSR